jgi:hypothetical protein
MTDRTEFGVRRGVLDVRVCLNRPGGEMTARDITPTDVEQALVSPDPKTEIWIEVVETFVGDGWKSEVQCPFCKRADLSILDAQAGAQADLRRWIFCHNCGERVSIPAVCIH